MQKLRAIITSAALIFRRARFLTALVSMPIMLSPLCVYFLYRRLGRFVLGLFSFLLLSPSYHNCYY
jgi:hypothetical protein